MIQARFSLQSAPLSRSLLASFLLATAVLLLVACKPDESPLKAEIETLHKQVAKQDSVIDSLQDGIRVMQEQIDLLNQELREAKQLTQSAKQEQNKLGAKLKSLSVQNKKLAARAKRALAKANRATENIYVEDQGGQTHELLHPLPSASEAAKEALSGNGYALRVTVKTEQRAVFVTERKVSAPASLEVPGFRNQYLVSLHALPTQGTLLSVKADFEKTGQGGRIVAAAPDETAEIERRLIAEITRKLANSNRAKP